jgi:DNA-binding transcriptional LysR family regulator
MRPTPEDLATFVHVVDSGTITAAAARLGVAKSVVSKRVMQLERQLAAKLLHRSSRRVAPTDTGALLYERARRVLAELDSLTDEVAARSGTLQGLIRVAGPMSFGIRHLGRIIARFMQMHERLEITLDLDDRRVDLLGGAYDFGIRIGHLSDSALRAKRLGVSHRILCCSPDYAARRELPTSLEALAEHVSLGYANAPAGHVWSFINTGGASREPRSLAMRGRLVSNSGEALLDAAVAGLGVAVLPDFMVGDLVRAGSLVAFDIPGWTMTPIPIHAVYAETSAMPLKVRALIDYAADNLREPFA